MARKQGHNIPSGPLFGAAYPTEQKAVTVKPIRTWAVIGVLAAIGISFLVVFAHSQGTTPSPTVSLHKVSASRHKVKPAAKSGKSISYYTTAVRANLFAPPLPPAPRHTEHVMAVRPMPVDPLAGWSYTGTVTVNGKDQALLEPSNGQPGEWVGVGSFFMGGKVLSVSQTSVTVKLNGEDHLMNRADTINPVPLNASATTAAPPPAAAAPKPGMPAPPAATAAPTMGTFALPQGFKITPQMRQAFARMRKAAGKG